MTEARDFIKTAAILSQRSKGATNPITRAEFVSQWNRDRQPMAEEVWDEVKKAQAVAPNIDGSRVRLCLTRLGARHMAEITTRASGSRLHWWMLKGLGIIVEIHADEPIRVFAQLPSTECEDIETMLGRLE